MQAAKIISTFTLVLCINQSGKSQCETCTPLNFNGDFELQNNIAGTSADLGISTGEVTNWYATHGTADYFNANWNWYYANGIEDNAGHICYGNRSSHDHSEGIFTEVNIKGSASTDYCLSLDLASFCNTSQHGKLHIYLANNLSMGGPNGFSFPRQTTHPTWFENTQLLDIITLDESTYFEAGDLAHFNILFNTEKDYTQLWIFTEFLYEDISFASCGVMIDNVKLIGATNEIREIQTDILSNNLVKFNAETNSEYLSYEWDFGNGTKSQKKNPTTVLSSGTHTISLKVTNPEGACDVKSKEITVAESTTQNELCSYDVCLDAGGVPTISSIDLVLSNGDQVRLNEQTSGFDFPYCIGVSNRCSSGEYELEYLIVDLQNWLKANNYNGNVSLKLDGCRGETLSINNTNLSFTALHLSYEDTHFTDTNYFEQYDCVKREVEKELILASRNRVNVSTYPNPATDFVNISFEADVESAQIILSNENGQQIIREELEYLKAGDSATLSIQSLRSGIYYIQLNSDKVAEVKKIIKI